MSGAPDFRPDPLRAGPDSGAASCSTLVVREVGGNSAGSAEAYWRCAPELRLRRNAVISTRTPYAERPLGAHALSVKMIRGGREEFSLRGQRLLLEDDVYLVLNGGQAYSSRLVGEGQVESFHIYFSAQFVDATLRGELTPSDLLLERGNGAGQWFAEQLFEHDRTVSSVLRYIERVCISGHTDPGWYEEQLRLLLLRMLGRHRQVIEAIGRLPAVKRSTRVEIYRRLVRAKDFILSSYDRPLSVRDIAEVSCLSISHLHVLFKSMLGVSPHQYLQRKRIEVACRYMLGERSMADIAAKVGMESRSTFFRAFRRIKGISPQAYRRRQRRGFNSGEHSANFAGSTLGC